MRRQRLVRARRARGNFLVWTCKYSVCSLCVGPCFKAAGEGSQSARKPVMLSIQPEIWRRDLPVFVDPRLADAHDTTTSRSNHTSRRDHHVYPERLSAQSSRLRAMASRPTDRVAVEVPRHGLLQTVDNDQVCTICQDLISFAETGYALQCGHVFHMACLREHGKHGGHASTRRSFTVPCANCRVVTRIEIAEKPAVPPDARVGRWVEVYWADDGAWYLGRVADQRTRSGRLEFKIAYTDDLRGAA